MAKLIVLQNQKQTIATQKNEINNEITAKCNSRVLVFEELQRVEKDIVLLEINLHLGDFSHFLQGFSTRELQTILKELNEIVTIGEKNKFRSVLQIIYSIRKQEKNGQLIEIKKVTDTAFPSLNGYTVTFKTYNNSLFTYHL